MTSAMPAGTVTFVFTDIEGSTRRLREWGVEAYAAALQQHRAQLREAFQTRGGFELGSAGDGLFFAFPTASGALAAARDGQLRLQGGELRVRVGIHTGEPGIAGGEYVGMDVHKAARIAAAGHGGQVLVSEQAAAVAGSFPLIDLGLHRLKDLGEATRLFQLAGAGLEERFPPLRTLDQHSHNLPLQPTPFVGRDVHVEGIVGRLRSPGARLLTLVGPAGTGKTRLALAAGAELVGTFEGGVYFVDLAPITDPSLLLPTIARTIGLRNDTGRDPLDAIRDLIAEKPTLLLLDNLEQIIDGAPEVARLLAAAPKLRVLATSRIPLRIRGEQEYPVPALELPDHGASGVAGLLRSEAVRLFLDRAQAIRPDFELTDRNARDVAEICRRVDGLPLGIELAAARVRLLEPAIILTRLSARLALLTGGSRDLPSRQQTLRGAIDWSHELLGPADRRLLRRLSVFSGGASLETIERVCADEEGRDPLEGISSLTEKSLLRSVGSAAGEPRVAMLETILEYAREKLRDSGELEATAERHAEYFAAIAEEGDAGLSAEDRIRWLESVEQEHENMRAALRWAIDSDALEVAARMAGGLQSFWMARGYLREGRRWMDEVIARGGEYSPRLRARVLVGAGALARQQGEGAAGIAYVQESLDLSRQLGDRKAVGRALINLGAAFGERGEIAQAERHLEDALGVLRGTGEDQYMAMVLTNLGVIAEMRGELERAEALYLESLTICRRIGDGAGASLATSNLGHIAYSRGDLAAAGRRFRESLVTARDSGINYVTVQEFANLALVAGGDGDHVRVATLIGAFEAQREATGASQMDSDPQRYEAVVRTARAALTGSQWIAAVETGRSMSLTDAIRYALQQESGLRVR